MSSPARLYREGSLIRFGTMPDKKAEYWIVCGFRNIEGTNSVLVSLFTSARGRDWDTVFSINEMIRMGTLAVVVY